MIAKPEIPGLGLGILMMASVLAGCDTNPVPKIDRDRQRWAMLEQRKCLSAASDYDFDMIESCVRVVEYLRSSKIDSLCDQARESQCATILSREEKIRNDNWGALAMSLARNSGGLQYFRDEQKMRPNLDRCLKAVDRSHVSLRRCISSKDITPRPIL